MTFLKTAYFSAILASMTGAATAATYECEIKKSNSGYIPEIVVVNHDEAKGTVIVYDPVIAHFNKETPLAGRVGINNAKRITFKWALKNIRTPGGQNVSGFNYSLTYIKGTGEGVVGAKPLGYTDNMRGSGKCVKR